MQDAYDILDCIRCCRAYIAEGDAANAVLNSLMIGALDSRGIRKLLAMSAPLSPKEWASVLGISQRTADIPRFVEQELRTYAPNADITFEVIGVTPEQIAEYDLPTRSTKTSDSRSKGWEGGSVELDALPPSVLRDIVSDAIVKHIDPTEWESAKAIERAERKTLANLVTQFRRDDSDHDPSDLFGR